jgi:hypothetical protein
VEGCSLQWNCSNDLLLRLAGTVRGAQNGHHRPRVKGCLARLAKKSRVNELACLPTHRCVTPCLRIEKQKIKKKKEKIKKEKNRKIFFLYFFFYLL